MLLLLLKGKGNLMVLKFTVFLQKEDHSKLRAFKAKSSFPWEGWRAGFQTVVHQSPSPGLP